MNLDRDFLARIAAETGFRGEMLEKVAHLLNLLRAIRENDFLRRRLALKGGTALNPDAQFAGGKWQLRYAASRGGQGNIEIDINYMFRVPLWPLNEKSSVSIGALQVEDYLLLDVHELAAGKLAALIDRSAARDLYDAVRLLSMPGLDRGRLRTGLAAHARMNPHN